MVSCTTQYNLYAVFRLSFIKETVAFCIAHLNVSRIWRFFLSRLEINFSTYSYWQGATVAGCSTGEGEQGSRSKSRTISLTSHSAQQSQQRWWLLGTAQRPEQVHGDEAGLRSSQDGTSAGHLCGLNRQGSQPGKAQLQHSCNAALVGSEGTVAA